MSNGVEHKVGRILVPVGAKVLEQCSSLIATSGDADNDKPSEDQSVRTECQPMECRDVFFSSRRFQGRPFYISHTGNRILVVDTTRIMYDEGKDPKSRLEARERYLEEKQKRRDERRRKRREDAEKAEMALRAPPTFPTRPTRDRPKKRKKKPEPSGVADSSGVGATVIPDDKVGTILLPIPLREDERAPLRVVEEPQPEMETEETREKEEHEPEEPPAQEKKVWPKSSEIERRLVYCSPDLFKGYPYYFSNTGNPILVLDPKKIEYFPDGVEPEEEVVVVEPTLEEEEEALNNELQRMLDPLTILRKQEEDLLSGSDEEEIEVEEENEEEAKRRRNKVGYIHITIPLKSGREEITTDLPSEGKDVVGLEDREGIIEVGPDNENAERSGTKNDDCNTVQPEEKVYKTRSYRTERRDVFLSRKCPHTMFYYLTWTGNRVVIMDKSRIDFFPPPSVLEQQAKEAEEREKARAKEAAAVEEEAKRRANESPLEAAMRREAEEALRKEQEAIEEQKRKEEEEEREYMALIGPGDDVKIGTIVVQKAPQAGKPITAEKEILDVYCRPPNPDADQSNWRALTKPYLLTRTGRRIYVMDRTDIRYRKEEKPTKDVVTEDITPEPETEEMEPTLLGTIDIPIPHWAQKENLESSDGEPKKYIRRDVFNFTKKYAGQPFYLSFGGNKIMVLDKRRIRLVGHEQTEEEINRRPLLKKPIVEPEPVEEESEEEPEEEETETEPKIVGAITIQVPHMDEERQWHFSKEKLEVFCLKRRSSDGGPLYFYKTGAKKEPVDERKIRYLRPDGTFPVDDEPQDEERDEEEPVPFDPREGLKVGTILVPLASVQPTESIEEKCREEKEIRAVYRSPEQFEGEPYYLTYSGNPILVVDPARIDYFPGMNPPGRLEKLIEEQAKEKEELKRLFSETSGMEKIGTILLRLPSGNAGGVTSEKRSREVYRVAGEEDGKEILFYFTETGNRIFIRDRERIQWNQHEEADSKDSNTGEGPECTTGALTLEGEKQGQQNENSANEEDIIPPELD